MEDKHTAIESPTLAKLGEALAKAQGEMGPAAKDSTNPHFKSRYADLAAIREAIRKPLATNGLCFFQRVSSTKDGVTVETTLLHSSGEFVRDSCWLPVQQQTPQAFGSAITYARRYSLSALVGVVADDDDDGNTASIARTPAHEPSEGERIASEPPPHGSAVEEVREQVWGKAMPNEQNPNDPVMKFGKGKGKKASELTEAGLSWYLDAARESVEKRDPKWHKANMAQLAALEAEAAKRSGHDAQ